VSGLHSGTNPISGDFSVGAEGLMVRGGAFAEPVREVTIASRESKQREQVVLERAFRIVHGLERIAAAAEGRPAPW